MCKILHACLQQSTFPLSLFLLPPFANALGSAQLLSAYARSFLKPKLADSSSFGFCLRNAAGKIQPLNCSYYTSTAACMGVLTNRPTDRRNLSPQTVALAAPNVNCSLYNSARTTYRICLLYTSPSPRD